MQKMKYTILIAFICILLSDKSCSNPSMWYNGLPIGTVIMFTGLELPANWLRCDGSNISRTTYSQLFSVIGTLYGVGDHVKTFALPDFSGRFPLGIQAKQKSSYKTGGEAEHVLTEDELPAHRHDTGTYQLANAGDHAHTYNDPGHNHGGSTDVQPFGFGQYWGSYHGGGADASARHAHSIPVGKTNITINSNGQHSHTLNGLSGSTGKGKQFNLLPPFQTIDFIILYQ